MYLYHYYDKRSGPFRSLTALTQDEADSVLAKIKQDRPASLTAQRDADYISKRMNCERIIRKEAENKGILMDISSPHYLVVENSPCLHSARLLQMAKNTGGRSIRTRKYLILSLDMGCHKIGMTMVLTVRKDILKLRYGLMNQ